MFTFFFYIYIFFSIEFYFYKPIIILGTITLFAIWVLLNNSTESVNFVICWNKIYGIVMSIHNFICLYFS